MMYPPELERELEAFIRWMAIMPQHFKTYQATPDALMRTARLSSASSDFLRSQGLYAVIAAVKEKLAEIVEDPGTLQRSEFTRDRSIKGYGGVIKSTKPE